MDKLPAGEKIMLKEQDIYRITEKINNVLKPLNIEIEASFIKKNAWHVYLMNHKTKTILICYYATGKRFLFDSLNRFLNIIEQLKEKFTNEDYYIIRHLCTISASYNYSL